MAQTDQALRDGPLGLPELAQEDTVPVFHRVGHDTAVRQFKIDGLLKCRRGDLQECFGLSEEIVARQPAMPVVHRLQQGIGDAGPGADHGRLRDAQLFGDLVGGLEADAPDIAGEPVGVLGHQRDRVRPVGLVDAHGTRRAHTMALEEHHDLADGFLVGPGGGNACHAFGADAAHLGQALRLLLDDVEDGFPERRDQPLGEMRADTLHQTRAEIFLNALQGRGGCRFQEIGRELLSMVAMRGPPPAGLDELAGADRRDMPDDGHEVTMAAHFDPQDRPASVGIVVGHAFDQTR